MKQKMAMLKQMAAVTEAQYLKEHAKIKPNSWTKRRGCVAS